MVNITASLGLCEWFIALFTTKDSKFSGYLNVTAIGVSFILSLYLAIIGLDKNFDYQSASFQWISFGILEITMAIMLDELTLIMISVVTAISFLFKFILFHTWSTMMGIQDILVIWVFSQLQCQPCYSKKLNSIVYILGISWGYIIPIIGFWYKNKVR